MIDNVISELKGVSDNVDMEFENWFIFAVKLGEEVNIDHQLQDGLCLKAKRLSYYKRRLDPIIRDAWLFHLLMM